MHPWEIHPCHISHFEVSQYTDDWRSKWKKGVSYRHFAEWKGSVQINTKLLWRITFIPGWNFFNLMGKLFSRMSMPLSTCHSEVSQGSMRYLLSLKMINHILRPLQSPYLPTWAATYSNSPPLSAQILMLNYIQDWFIMHGTDDKGHFNKLVLFNYMSICSTQRV